MESVRNTTYYIGILIRNKNIYIDRGPLRVEHKNTSHHFFYIRHLSVKSDYIFVFSSIVYLICEGVRREYDW